MKLYKILIVDDEELVRNLLVSLFSKHGHTCDTAGDGLEALEKVSKNSFDAVVPDIMMPRMNGIDLTKELVKLHPDLPILIITGQNGEYSAESAIAVGAREFIRKPFSLSKFILRFNKMIYDHEHLCTVRQKKDEIIFHLHRESSERIGELKKKIEALERRSNHFEPDVWREFEV